MGADDRLLLGEASVREVLTSVYEVKSLPVLEESTKVSSALKKLAPGKESPFAAALEAVDSARGKLVSALKREEREGGNPSLRVESAEAVAEGAEALGRALDVVRRSVETAEEDSVLRKTDPLEVAWSFRGCLADVSGKAKKFVAKVDDDDATSSVKRQKRLVTLLAFDAKSARVTAGLARALAARRHLHNDAYAAASANLRSAAGAWQCVRDDDSTKLDLDCFPDVSTTGALPLELDGHVSAAMRAASLAAADRLAILTAIQRESTPATLPARLCAGASDLERSAVDHFAASKRAVLPSLVGISCALAGIGSALTDAFWGRACRADDHVGKAVAYCKRSTKKLGDFVDATKGGGQAWPDLKFAAAAPASYKELAKSLGLAVKRRLDAYDKENKIVYFESVDVASLKENPAGPLSLAKPTLNGVSDECHDLAEPPEKSTSATTTPPPRSATTPPPRSATTPPPSPAPSLSRQEAPPPSYSSMRPPSYDEVSYQAIRVTLPAGYSPGDKLVVEGPDGRRVETVVPAGAAPGDVVEVNTDSFSNVPGKAPAPVHRAAPTTVVPAPPETNPFLSFSSERSSSSIGPSVIACPRCTFNNPYGAKECEMCGAAL